MITRKLFYRPRRLRTRNKDIHHFLNLNYVFRKTFLTVIGSLAFVILLAMNIQMVKTSKVEETGFASLSLVSLAAQAEDEDLGNRFDGRFCNPSGLPGGHYVECYSIDGDFCNVPYANPDC